MIISGNPDPAEDLGKLIKEVSDITLDKSWKGDVVVPDNLKPESTPGNLVKEE